MHASICTQTGVLSEGETTCVFGGYSSRKHSLSDKQTVMTTLITAQMEHEVSNKLRAGDHGLYKTATVDSSGVLLF